MRWSDGAKSQTKHGSKLRRSYRRMVGAVGSGKTTVRSINGILWRLRTVAPWRDLPPRYGPWQTCYDRFVRWRRDGTWDRLLSRAQTKSDAVGELEWELSVDATIARAHQHAAGARREASQQDAKRGLKTPKKRRLGGAAED